MTKYKLIEREPKGEMIRILDLAYQEGKSYRDTLCMVFDAAPDIETEAEKKAKEYLVSSAPKNFYQHEAVEIIRALLRERGKI